MGLSMMKQRVKQSGASVREEMIKDGRNLLEEELDKDPSYSPTMYVWKYDVGTGFDDRHANLRIYGRGQSSLTGNYQKFLTTVDTPLYIGNYLHDLEDDTHWLVDQSFNEDGIHYRGRMIQCNYNLRYQLKDGTIIERYANIVSAAKYNTGRNDNDYIKLTSNNFTVLIGYDEYGLELDFQKVFIDINENNPTKVFDITRSDDVLFNSGNMGGLLSFIASKTEFNPAADSPEMRLCNYLPTTKKEKPVVVSGLIAHINGLPQLKLAFPRTYSVSFEDTQHTPVEYEDYEWEVDADFTVIQELVDGDIKLRVDADCDCGKQFILRVLVDGETIAETQIMVVEGM